MTMRLKGRALPLDAHVGLRVRHRREALNISQTALGEASGITFQQVQKYEKGVNRISASRLQQFADALEVDVGYFFEGAAAGKGKQKARFTDQIGDLAKSAERRALIEAFSRIKNKSARKRVIQIAREAAQ